MNIFFWRSLRMHLKLILVLRAYTTHNHHTNHNHPLIYGSFAVSGSRFAPSLLTAITKSNYYRQVIEYTCNKIETFLNKSEAFLNQGTSNRRAVIFCMNCLKNHNAYISSLNEKKLSGSFRNLRLFFPFSIN